MKHPISDADIGFTTAVDLAKSYKSKTLSPSEATDALFRHIKTLNPSLNAFSVIMEKEAKMQAIESCNRFQVGTARTLEGIPVTIKDFYDVKGYASETASFSIRHKIAKHDNPVVARLRNAGAIILGKTTMSEFAWSGISRNPVNGTSHNPWGHGLNAGASSAGAGVASAAGFGPLHLGSDGAGSIRMPAHFCGVFGLKPTYGRIPHVPVSNNDYGTYIGPMTRTVEDSALMLKVMSGSHHLDHTSCESPPEDYLANLNSSMKGKKVAFSVDLGHAKVDPEIVEIVSLAADTFRMKLGADVREFTPDWGPEGAELGRFFWSAYQGRNADLLKHWRDRMDPGLVNCIEAGASFTSAEYLKARECKYNYISKIAATLEDWDFLITPTASVAAFPVEGLGPDEWKLRGWDWMSWAEFSYPFNMSQSPAASVPCGFTKDGRPVGLQIVARRFADLQVLQASYAFQQATGIHRRRPDFSNL